MVKIVISVITGQEEGTKKRKKPNKKAKGDKKSRKPVERIVMKEIAVKKVTMMVMTMRTTTTILTCFQSLTVHLVKTHVDRNRYIRESAFG